jgi:hypothetical protein
MLRQRSIKTERQLCPQSGHLIGLQRMAAESPNRPVLLDTRMSALLANDHLLVHRAPFIEAFQKFFFFSFMH